MNLQPIPACHDWPESTQLPKFGDKKSAPIIACVKTPAAERDQHTANNRGYSTSIVSS
ncbi:hypothetical protein EMIT048CA2_10114 [Pseudomonas chlororaphis]